MATEKNTILIVEDSDEDYEALEWAVRKTGRDCVLKRFIFADDAVNFLSDNPLPNLILLDLNLQGTSGHEMLRTIKENDKMRVIPVIVMTTSSAPRDIEFCYRHGAAGYVAKPVNLNKFTRSLQMLMDYWFEAVILPCAN